MKYVFRCAVVLLLILTMLPFHAFAAEAAETDRIYFEDGSYITVELQVFDTRASSIKTANKTYIYNNGDGVEKWRAVLYASFSYDGITSTCTASTCTVTIADTDWYEVSRNATRSGASALVELTMGREYLGITYTKKTINMSITCDKDGNLS